MALIKSKIREWAETEIVLDDFEDSWESYRTLAREGIFKGSEANIRNLHAQMSMMLSHKIIQKSLCEQDYERTKLYLDMDKSRLLHTTYKDGTVSANQAAVMNDDEYKKGLEKVMDKKSEFLILEAEVSALQTAVISLSRELTARTK